MNAPEKLHDIVESEAAPADHGIRAPAELVLLLEPMLVLMLAVVLMLA